MYLCFTCLNADWKCIMFIAWLCVCFDNFRSCSVRRQQWLPSEGCILCSRVQTCSWPFSLEKWRSKMFSEASSSRHSPSFGVIHFSKNSLIQSENFRPADTQFNDDRHRFVCNSSVPKPEEMLYQKLGWWQGIVSWSEYLSKVMNCVKKIGGKPWWKAWQEKKYCS